MYELTKLKNLLENYLKYIKKDEPLTVQSLIDIINLLQMDEINKKWGSLEEVFKDNKL